MTYEIDGYDVQRMIEDEARNLRGRTDELRRDVNASVDELRADVYDLRSMIAGLRDDLAALDRVVQSRTEHLA